MIKLVLATSNENKVKEYNAILKNRGIKVVSLTSLGLKLPNIKENGKTFKANALIKAKVVAKLTDLPVIADDSGLCIEALNNFPGLHSARYAKRLKGFSNANRILVNKLKTNRKAYFVCSIALVNWFDKPVTVLAKAYGKIATTFNNDIGFGYDPIFIPNGYKLSYNQLPISIKNKISHRAKACNLLIKLLAK